MMDVTFWDGLQCDGMFLIFDTARHGGWKVDVTEVEAHIEECEDCKFISDAIAETDADASVFYSVLLVHKFNHMDEKV